MIVGINCKTGSVIEEVVPIDDPGPNEVIDEVLQPNGILSGAILLLERLPTLEENLRESDVVVFWTYKVRMLSGRSSRQGGWVLLERRRE
jgi:hypothetical protein